METNYNAVMVDLEALSTESNAAIIAIGAVKFYLNVTQESFTEDQLFYTSVSAKSSQEAGLHIDGDTVMWWMKQEDAARQALKNPLSLTQALHAFSRFVPKDAFLFGNGANYDNVVLRNAYKATRIAYPISYKRDSCYRTMCKLSDAPVPKFEGVKHTALADAMAQTRHLMVILEKIPWVKF